MKHFGYEVFVIQDISKLRTRGCGVLSLRTIEGAVQYRKVILDDIKKQLGFILRNHCGLFEISFLTS